MRSERKKALMLISITFIVGVLIGALAVGLWSKQSRGGRSTGWQQNGRESFIKKILSVIEADSVQAKEIRPHINETILKIDSLQVETNRNVRAVLDSLELKLTDILKPEQMERLKEFHRRGRKDKPKN